MSGGERAALRDASRSRRASGPLLYHVVGDGGAACSGVPLVTEGTELPVADMTVDAAVVPGYLRCMRRGCRERWPGPGEGK